MDIKDLLAMAESINDHREIIDEAHCARLDGETHIEARIPALTQNPVGHMIATELLPDNAVPVQRHEIDKVITFGLMSLEVEIPNLVRALDQLANPL